MRIMIVGAGGHGQVVADILLAAAAAGSELEPIAFLDDARSLHGEMRLGLPIVGDFAKRAEIEYDGIVVAIGNNRIRRRLFEILQHEGAVIVPAIHPNAVVATEVSIGQGCMLCAGAIVNTGSSLGPNTIINTGATVDHHNRIGSHTHIAPGVHLGGDVTIGDDVLVGIGATVMPGRSVGSGATVGAGALVNGDVAAGHTVIGVPARSVKL